jgi:hypothetical protein
MDARLDAVTRAKVDDLAQRFHQSRAAVLCHIMHWGLSRGPTTTLDGGASEGPVRHLSFSVDTALHARVAEAAIATGVKRAPWLRAMVRHITTADFPASWQAERQEERSHDSQTYDTRVMLRLDAASRVKLEALVKRLKSSKAAIIRQLIRQATPDEFPTRWPMNARAHLARHPSRLDPEGVEGTHAQRHKGARRSTRSRTDQPLPAKT